MEEKNLSRFFQGNFRKLVEKKIRLFFISDISIYLSYFFFLKTVLMIS